jgi:GNAT superfamily N-acetyltransferase
MTFKIRPWHKTSEEAQQIFEIIYTCFPLFPRVDPCDCLTILLKSTKKFEAFIYTAYINQRMVGYALLRENQAQQPTMMCAVLPTERSQGIGEALFVQVTKEVRARGHKVLNSFAFSSNNLGISFLETRNFIENDRVSWTSFDLSSPWPKWALEKVNTAQQLDIQIIDGVELETLRDDWAKAWWRLQNSVLLDVPSKTPFSETPFDEWLTYIDPPFTYRDLVLFAIQEGELIGSLNLGSLKGDKMNINHTGVARAYRRNGISILLKYKAFELAKTKGAKFITTQNHNYNHNILTLNLKLGFQLQDEYIDYAKVLE